MSKENERTIAVYEEYGKNYLERNITDIQNNPKAKKDDEQQIELFMRYTEDVPPDAKIFEVGSASGRDAKIMVGLGFHNITVSDAVDFFIDNLIVEGFTPIKFNLITDNFPSKYDIILCWAVLVHFTKSEAISSIKKIYDALNVGGKFIFSVKHKEGHDEEWDDYQNRIGAKRYFTYWDKEEITKVLKDTGFNEISVEQYGGARACWLQCCAKKSSSEFV